MQRKRQLWNMKKTLLSFGHGYSAQWLAKLLLPQGWHIIGTTRSATKAQNLADQGIEPLIFPGGDVSGVLGYASHLLVSVGPTLEGDPVLKEVGDLIRKYSANYEWVGYLSTTGVYGDYQGKWIDEDTPLNPSTQRGQWRKGAETEWRAISKLPLHIFRLAGIYGPGRGPFAKVRDGTVRRIIKPGQVFSRTHIEDIAQVLVASIERPAPGTVYNVCDNSPAPPEDVIAYAAELLGLPVPPAIPFETAEMSPMARSFYAENKRINNDRIKTDLGVKLRYPSYKEGLLALLNEDVSRNI